MQSAAEVLSVPFNDRPMTVLQLGTQSSGSQLGTPDVPSQPYLLAAQVGDALGYAEGSFKARLNEWSDHLRPNKDVLTLDGDDLAALKVAGAVGLRARSVLLLSESGLYRVLMLSRKKAALRLQEWLADEVLPAIRRTGSYTSRPFKAALEALPDDPFVVPARPVLELLDAEARLGQQLPLIRAALAASGRSRRKTSPASNPDVPAEVTAFCDAHEPVPHHTEGTAGPALYARYVATVDRPVGRNRFYACLRKLGWVQSTGNRREWLMRPVVRLVSP